MNRHTQTDKTDRQTDRQTYQPEVLVGGVVDLAVGFGGAFGFTCATVVLLTADELVRQTDRQTGRWVERWAGRHTHRPTNLKYSWVV